jgi:GNAT superfamily N-acetyltransferase
MEIKNILDVPQEIAKKAYDATNKQFVDFPESTKIITLIATIDNEVCAVGSLGSSDLTYGLFSDKGPWIADLWVHPKYRGRGVARTLVENLLGVAKTLGYDDIYMWTSDSELRNYLQTFAVYLGLREYCGHVIYVFSMNL